MPQPARRPATAAALMALLVVCLLPVTAVAQAPPPVPPIQPIPVPPPPPAPETATPTVERVAGSDRIATAAALAERAAAPGAPVAYVASSADFADALAGGPAAARAGAALLLTEPGALPPATADALTRLRPQRIVVLGGPAAVADAVLAALAPLTAGEVTRLAGGDRYATAAAVSAATTELDGVIHVASGAAFPDALAGGAAAAAADGPVLLVEPAAVPPATAAELARLDPARIVLLGGPAAVSAAIEQRLGAITGAPVTRVGGADRYATAAALATEAESGTALVLAAGDAFPDALASVPLAAAIGGPVLLAPLTDLPPAADDVLAARRPANVVIAGGLAALNENVERFVRERLGIAPDGDADEDPFEPVDVFLDIADADLDFLYADPFRGERVPGEFRRAPGRDPLPAGVEFRGNSSLSLGKKSFDVEFDEDQPFLFGGTDRLDMNASFTDPSGMRERLAYGVFDDLGVPVSRTRHLDLHVNGVYEGLYTYFERVGEEFLEHRGLDPEGMLLRDELREFSDADEPGFPDRQSSFGVDLDTVEDPRAYLEEVFSSDAADPDYDRLEDLVRWVHDTSAGPAYAEGFVQRVDLDQFADFISGHVLTGDNDAYGDDYHLYYDLTDPAARWQLIPRDNDLSFGKHTRGGATINDYWSYQHANVATFGNELVAKALETPELRREIDARIAFHVDEVFTTERIAARVGTIGGVIADNMQVPPSDTAFVRQEAQHFGLQGYHRLHRENLVDFVELRRAHLDRVLRPVPGEPYTAEVDLTGAAPGDRVLFTDPTGWTIGTLTVTSAERAGLTRLTVEPGPQVGVDRVWRLDSTGELSGRLSLHFRNELGGVPGVPVENWFRTDDAIGPQLGLQVVQGTTPLASEANPWSDKVSADVTVPAGPTTFTLEG